MNLVTFKDLILNNGKLHAQKSLFYNNQGIQVIWKQHNKLQRKDSKGNHAPYIEKTKHMVMLSNQYFTQKKQLIALNTGTNSSIKVNHLEAYHEATENSIKQYPIPRIKVCLDRKFCFSCKTQRGNCHDQEVKDEACQASKTPYSSHYSTNDGQEGTTAKQMNILNTLLYDQQF